MKRRKIIWLFVAALLWFWAALVAGVTFPQLPAVFAEETAGRITAGLSVNFELFLFGALALFLILFDPIRKIWVIAGFLGILLLLKKIWLAPLVLSSFQWEYPPLSYLPVIFVFTELIKFVVLLQTSFWLFTQITSIAKAEERYHLFISSRKSLKQHLSPDQKMQAK